MNEGEECDDGNQSNGDGCSSTCQDEDSLPPPPVPVSGCGNGIIETSEKCDDGNTFNGDGCSSLCKLEKPLEYCGDGKVGYRESCDDGNQVNGDGCSNRCSIEIIGYCGDGDLNLGETCDDGNQESGDGCSLTCFIEPSDLYCGDEIISSGEFCDDGNQLNGDGCNNICVVEKPYPPYCGDGDIDSGEECDDGNQNNGDGCSVVCIVEPFCGDNILNGSETCDDGNSEDGDGCNRHCRVETNYEYCGDGFILNDEDCDDGNYVSGDGCSTVCIPEYLEFCGNGKVEGGEECDDGNQLNGDGCSIICQEEVTPYCGDGIINNEEECDDGNHSNMDGCSANCKINLCGNFTENREEGCDDGNGGNGDGCSVVCGVETYAFCGDNVLQDDEECDDGNQLNGDGCSNVCYTEVNGYCGDGNVRGDEECDDGNQYNSDGCSNVCLFEKSKIGSDIEELPLTGDDESGQSSIFDKALAIVDEIDEELTVFVGATLITQFVTTALFLGGPGNVLTHTSTLMGVIFDRKKRKTGWGVVYDYANNNRPIAFAVVRLLDASSGNVLDETVTDLDGRYRFNAFEGSYKLVVEHSDYQMVNQTSAGKDLLGKYLGGAINFRESRTIAYDIPMQYKFMAKRGSVLTILDKLKLFTIGLGLIINIIGVILIILSLAVNPSILNFGILLVNVAVITLVVIIKRLYWRDWGRVLTLADNNGVSGVFVRLFDTKDNKLINTQVSDNSGRFGFILDEGNYVITADSDKYESSGEVEFSVSKEGSVIKKNILVQKKSAAALSTSPSQPFD